MAKCLICRSCMRVVRVDREDGALITWYCSLCQKAFNLKTKELVSEEELPLIKEKYTQIYGKKI